MMDTTWPRNHHDVFWLERWVQRTVVKYPHVIIQKGYGGSISPHRLSLILRCTIKFQYIHNCIEHVYLVSTPRLQKVVTKAMKERRFRLIPITESEFVHWMEERGTWHTRIRRAKEWKDPL